MEITVKDFIEQLKAYPDDSSLHFGGLDFLRLKDRGGLVQVEFNETVYKNGQGDVVVENH